MANAVRRQHGEAALAHLRRLTQSEALLVWVFVVAVVVVANVVYITGVTNSDPLPQRSGIGTSLTYGIAYGSNTIDPNDGFTTQALGHLAASELLHGNLPYWDHYMGVGAPLAGEMQPAAFFPFVVLLALPAGMLVMHLILEVLAGVATAFFLLRLGVRLPAALAGAALFALNGTFAWITSAGFNPVAFLPIALLGAERARAAADGRGPYGFRLLALALALSLYAGFPETAYIDALFAAAWALVRMVGLRSAVRLRYLRKLCVGGVIGLLLAAPVLVVFVGYLPDAGIGQHSSAVGHASVVRSGIPNMIMPYVTGPIFGFTGFSANQDLIKFWDDVGGYLTATMVCLGLIGLCSGRLARSLRIFLAVFVAICLIKIFALLGDFSHFVNVIPGLSSAMFYRYSPPALALAVTILAAFGIDHLLVRQSRRAVVAGFGGTATVLAVALLMARHQVALIDGAPGRLAWAVGSAVLAVGCVAAVGVLVVARPRLRPRVFAVLLLALPVAESTVLYALPQLSAPHRAGVDDGLVRYLQQHLGDQRYYTFGPLAPNYGSFYRISSINQNELPYPRLWGDYVQARLDANADPVTFTGFARVDPDGPSALAEFTRNVENYRAVGVAYVVAPKGLVSDTAAASIGLVPAYASTTADVFALPGARPYVEAPGCRVSVDSRDSFGAHCSKGSTAIRRELFMKGWTATVNGEVRPIARTETIFQSVDLPPGDSRITFSYAPPYIRLGYLAFVVGVFALARGLLRRAGGVVRRRSAGASRGTVPSSDREVPRETPADMLLDRR